MRIPSFKRLTQCVVLILIQFPALATDYNNDPDLQTIKELSSQFSKGIGVDIPSNAPTNKNDAEALLHANEVFGQIQQRNTQLFSPQETEDKLPAGRKLIFASLSIPGPDLLELMAESTTENDAVVVFRGVRDHLNFTKSYLELQRLAGRQTPVANILLDPSLYKKYRINKVPTIVHLDKQRESELGRVAGLVSTDYLVRKIGEGNSGDFGVKGSVYDILERDLIEVMKERIEKIDWAEKKDRALNRFWTNQRFETLERATVNRKRAIDPSITITADIKDAEGGVIVKKGTVLNPLDMREFTMALVVFDPTDNKQVEVVDRILPELKVKHSRVKLLVTQLDIDKGWDGYKSVTDYYDSEIFKLTPDVKQRFLLERVPSVITAQGKMFINQEYGVDEDR